MSIRTEYWKMLSMNCFPDSGPHAFQKLSYRYEEGKDVLVSVNGSAEVQIGFRGCFFSWNFFNKLTLEVDSFTNIATFQNYRMGFVMTVVWKGDDPSSLMHKLIVDEASGRILGASVPPPPSNKELSLKSVSDASLYKGGKSHQGIMNKDSRMPQQQQRPPLNIAPVRPKPQIQASTLQQQQQQHQQHQQQSKRQRTVQGVVQYDEFNYDRQQQQANQNKIQIVVDEDHGKYQSLLVTQQVVMDGAGNGGIYWTDGYEDTVLDDQILRQIQNMVDKRGEQNPFAYCDSGLLIRLIDARLVVPSVHVYSSRWLNDNIMYGYMQLFRKAPQSGHNFSKIHYHNEFTSVNLYKANLRGIASLREEAMRTATQTQNYKVMSTRLISFMVVNLYSDHWYLLVIYIRLKRIHCLNWFGTSDGNRNMLCRLLHVYLTMHHVVDSDFAFDPREWTFCVIDRNRVPAQDDGFNCGVITLLCMEYLIAGRALTFGQPQIDHFRFKILVALKLNSIPWLYTPRVALNTEEVLRMLALTPVALRPVATAETAADIAHRDAARQSRVLLEALIAEQGQEQVEAQWLY